MKQLITSLVALAIILNFSSCEKVVGTGPRVAEIRNVSNFTGISSEMSGKVNFSIAPVYKVEIIAQQNILDVVKTNVINGVLHIDFKNGVYVKRHEDITINIFAPAAEYFRLSGSGNMDLTGDIAANDLRLIISGSGNINVQKVIVAGKIDARLSGSGNLTIQQGTTANEELEISGSGKMDLAGVSAGTAETKITGSGDMRVMLSGRLDATITGSGSVYYRGNPIISTRITGSGRLIPF